MFKQVQMLAGVLFVGILIYAGLWYTAAFQAEKDVAALLSKWRDNGLKVEHGKIEHGGFPYRITVNIKNLEVATRKHGLEVDVKDMLLVSHVWTPQHWLIESNGVQIKTAQSSSILTSDFLLSSYRVHDDGKTLVAFDSTASKGFSIVKLLGTEVATPETWQFFLRFGGTDTGPQSGLYGERYLNFKLTANRTDTSFDFLGGISGPKIKDWTETELQNWSNEGGLLEIDKFTITASEARITGNSSLTLDERNRPLGSTVLNVSSGQKLPELLPNLDLPKAAELPENGPVSLMIQNGEVTLNGKTIYELKPLVD